MAKAVLFYTGGVQYLIERAVREDGMQFSRYQSKTFRGYQWSAWKCDHIVWSKEQIETPAGSIEAGFSNLFLRQRKDIKVRLPN